MTHEKPQEPRRRRLRELGITIGKYPTGKLNSITDVKGVKVGHATLIQGHGKMTSRKSGPVRTGVTAIIPNDNVFMESVTAGSYILNGAGEVSGITQVSEWGIIESPILLTNTLSVGNCSDGVISYMTEKYPGIGNEYDVIIPLVGECDDSWLNNITGSHLKKEHVFEAINKADSGLVPEGSVGGGTGMITCDFKGGIGSSSRKVLPELGGHTIGVLVQSNFGDRPCLRVDGVPVGKILNEKYQGISIREDNYGSIIVVIATDAPLSSHQLNRLCKRASLGIGRVGSYAAHGSGEIVLSFSTANVIRRDSRRNYHRLRILPDKLMNQLYEAIIEATEEAIVNSICMSEPMFGINNRFCPALPLEELSVIMEEYKKAEKNLSQNEKVKQKYKVPEQETTKRSKEV